MFNDNTDRDKNDDNVLMIVVMLIKMMTTKATITTTIAQIKTMSFQFETTTSCIRI